MQPTPLSVSQLNAYVRMLMEGDALLSEVMVAGEVSNFTESRPGHFYFTLKDTEGQLRSVMFRSAVSRLSFRPADGMRVVAYGRISVYAPMGQYQLYVEALRPDGAGALAAEFERLRRALEAEGLFDPGKKRPIPPYPERIGIITSPYGAAIRDLLRILGRRYPVARVTLFPSLVQGSEAPAQLIEGLHFFASVERVDLIILGRGGGSAEDLWAFNDEALVRAVAACPIPVISAVGHENDVTLCDYAADLRASTPSAAAELAVPDRGELLRFLRETEARLCSLLLRRTTQDRRLLSALAERGVLTHPERLLEAKQQRADRAAEALDRGLRRYLEQLHTRLGQNVGRLDALSPLAVMRRGYAAVQTERMAITSASSLAVGDVLRLRFADGSVTGRVTSVETEKQGERSNGNQENEE